MSNDNFNLNDYVTTLMDLLTKGFSPSTPVKRTEINGYIISTVNTVDKGLETAIIDTTNKVYPVERYDTIEKALEKHDAWVKFIEDGNKEIVELGYGILEDRTITLA